MRATAFILGWLGLQISSNFWARAQDIVAHTPYGPYAIQIQPNGDVLSKPLASGSFPNLIPAPTETQGPGEAGVAAPTGEPQTSTASPPNPTQPIFPPGETPSYEYAGIVPGGTPPLTLQATPQEIQQQTQALQAQAAQDQAVKAQAAQNQAAGQTQVPLVCQCQCPNSSPGVAGTAAAHPNSAQSIPGAPSTGGNVFAGTYRDQLDKAESGTESETRPPAWYDGDNGAPYSPDNTRTLDFSGSGSGNNG